MSNEFIAGRTCLDFANTVDWRAAEAPEELLPDYSALVAWSVRAGTLDAADASRLDRRARAHPRAAATALRRALGLREGIHRVFLAHAHDESPEPADLALVARAYADALGHGTLVPGPSSPGYVWTFGASADFDRPAWPLALSAVELLESDVLSRVGECGGRGCGWLFLDETRNHGRRWCVSSACGNRERVRRYYARQTGAART